MRRLRRMMAAHEGKRKGLVQFTAHQTCLKPAQIYNLVAAEELRAKISRYLENEEPQPHHPHSSFRWCWARYRG